MAWVELLARRHERHMRESFADSLEQAVAAIDEPLHRGGAAVPVNRSAVAEAAPLLLQVAERLREGPPTVEAMRLVRELVTNGAGPLYSPSPHRSAFPPGTLARSAREILAAAEGRSSLRGKGELVRG